jgi:glycosyltransferase involved in cell wall biosynthesis
VRRFPGFAPSNAYFIPSWGAYRYLREVEADLVHAHNIGALLVPACWLAIRGRRDRMRFVLSPHHHAEGSMWHTRVLWSPYGPVAGTSVRSADCVHCVSEYEAGLVRKDFGVEPVVVPNGVSEDVFRYRWAPPSEGLVLTYAGRLERFKRVDRLIEAASVLGSRGRSVTVRVVGDGPDLGRLMDVAARRGVCVEPHHFLERGEYLDLVSRSSCFVNLSRFEAYSIVTAEAVAMWVPVVVALPWGRTFEGYSKTVPVYGESGDDVAEAVEKAVSMKADGAGAVPSWKEVVDRLVRDIYAPTLSVVVEGVS